jgi:hypothetical protein
VLPTHANVSNRMVIVRDFFNYFLASNHVGIGSKWCDSRKAMASLGATFPLLAYPLQLRKRHYIICGSMIYVGFVA